MNTLNFNQTGGFPLTTQILDEIQKAYTVFNSLGAIVGDKTIISGCVTTGSLVSNGVVFLNGEVFEFRGGTAQTKVRIFEEVENKVFEDAVAKPVIKTRYVGFGTGVGAVDWVDFKRGFETKNLADTFTGINQSLAAIVAKLNTIDENAKVQKQSDFNQSNDNEKDFIKNKPQEFYQYGTVTTQNRQQGFNEFDYSKNYAEIFPPEGYTMTHLKAFIPSIAKIDFAGNVDSSDSLWCNFQNGSDRIRVSCNNSESRETSKINYLAIWKK